jgi:protein phosphatase
MTKGKELRLISYGSTCIGRVRPVNEDAFLRDDHMRLYAVADGVGGQPAGEVASATALRELAKFLKFYSASAGDRSVATMLMALRKVSDAVLAHGLSDMRYHGMATTLTACWITHHRIILGHVGDSEAFLLHAGKIKKITVSHTVAGELVNRGVSAEHPVMKSSLSHMLTQSLGPEPLHNPQVCEVEMKHHDILMVCSDGVTREMLPSEISHILRHSPAPEQAVEELLRLADERGGHDNATAVVVKAL